MRFQTKTLIFLFILPLLSACRGGLTSSRSATQSASPADSQTATSPFELIEDTRKTSLSNARNEWFATAGSCIACHQNIRDQGGVDFSPAEAWRPTMMANSARDPYFHASLAFELENAPEYQSAIQEKCATCHTPMARFSALARGQAIYLVGDQSVLQPQHPDFSLAMDGVSCTVCHQIPPVNQNLLRHSGDLDIDLTTPYGQRKLYGPLPMSRQSISMMVGASGYEPVESEHIRESSLCASCHELYLNYIQADGSLSQGEDTFPEQTPFSEWLASDQVQQRSCQDCHLSRAEEELPISNLTPKNTYPAVTLHNFIGGNAYMLSLLNNFGSELGVEADTEHFRNTIAETLVFLQTQTAALEILNPQIENDILSFDVSIDVLTGHKFPTSFPSRRAWLHIVITDSQGKPIFESGATDSQGRIFGNDNDTDPTAFEPHYDLIRSPEEVQIYESILQDINGKVTTLQLHASTYLKDNRLLPKGFEKQTAPAHIAVHGAALEDANFLGGRDLLSVEVDVSQAQMPLTIQVALLYQTIGYRWAQNVLASSSAAADDFARYWQFTPNLPVQIAAQSISIGK